MKTTATLLAASVLALAAGVAHATNPPVQSNIMKTKHDTVKNSISNIR
jgi:hypothetical protein